LKRGGKEFSRGWTVQGVEKAASWAQKKLPKQLFLSDVGLQPIKILREKLLNR
jgi:hypothetical protein